VNTTLPTCSISIGPAATLEAHTVRHLRAHFCPIAATNKPCHCSTCAHIINHQYHAITWITPTKEYVIKDLNPLFEIIRFSLEPETSHFFIITHAERLSTICANRLLKVLEEPPAGYHFLMLTENYNALLSTIQSRGIVLYTAENMETENNALLSFFTDYKKGNNPLLFEQALKAHTPTVSQTRTLLHQLVHKIDRSLYTDAAAVEKLLLQARKHPPQSGGAALCLKMVYLGLHHLRISS